MMITSSSCSIFVASAISILVVDISMQSNPTIFWMMILTSAYLATTSQIPLPNGLCWSLRPIPGRSQCFLSRLHESKPRSLSARRVSHPLIHKTIKTLTVNDSTLAFMSSCENSCPNDFMIVTPLSFSNGSPSFFTSCQHGFFTSCRHGCTARDSGNHLRTTVGISLHVSSSSAALLSSHYSFAASKSRSSEQGFAGVRISRPSAISLAPEWVSTLPVLSKVTW